MAKNKLLSGQLLVKSRLGNIVVSRSFQDTKGREYAYNSVIRKHAKEILSGEWVLSYLIY